MVHKLRAYFQLGIISWRENPGARSTSLTALAHSGGLEGTETTTFYSAGLSLPMMYRLATNTAIKPSKKNRKKILRIKNYPVLFVIFFSPFRFKVIRIDWEMI